MKEQEYLEQRVEDQFNWLEKKAAQNKTKYKRVQTFIVIISVLIPFLSGYITDQLWWLKVVVGIGGVLIAIFQGVLSLQKYQELWTQYRMTAETVKREKLLYLTKAGKYKSLDDPFPEFVVNVEAILSSENQAWFQQVNQKDDKKKP